MLEIKNENYISATENLIAKFLESSDADYLEIVHIIFSKPAIASRFTTQFINESNKLFQKYGFDAIKNYQATNSIGEAEFPAVGEKNDNNSIRAIIVIEGTENNKIDERIESKNDLSKVLNYAQSQIQRNLRDYDDEKIRDVTILNWGLDLNLREHLLSGTKLISENRKFFVKGNSLHFAAVTACFSKLFNLPIDGNYIFTGAFNDKGESVRIDSIIEKTELIMKERPNTETIFIPPLDTFNINEKQYILSHQEVYSEIKNIADLIEKVFQKDIEELSKMNPAKRKSLGRARIWAESIKNKEIKFYSNLKYEEITETRNCVIFHFDKEQDDREAFKIFPPGNIYYEFDGPSPNFIILEGSVANHYTGYMMACNQFRQSDAIFGVRLGRSSKVIVFAAPRIGANLIGFECDFF